jgi:CubicO group peptidase (beta-lactamase class C family)
MLDRPMSDDPGTRWNYNSGCSHLLSAILTKQTGQSAEEFARANLFRVLGITNWLWLSSPNGVNAGGWGLDLHPANMAIFGYLYLKNGLFNGRQVVSEEWINESTAKHMEVTRPDSGIHSTDYGYQWYRMLPTLDFSMFYAPGAGGQFIAILPDHNMVVVMTAENMETHATPALVMLAAYILPAVKEN